MKSRTRCWLFPPLLLAVVAASCAQLKEKEIRAVVQQYLDYEVAGDYQRQHALIDAESAKVLPIPVGELRNPFDPKQMTSYQIWDIVIEGAEARARVSATFQMTWAGGGTGMEEQHDLIIYLVHQPEEWKVNEIKTRTEALDRVLGAGYGDNWLLLETQKAQFQGQQ